jgi:hypothetical protein
MRDVDDLHSKRVGSLIKQRFVAKELVSSLKKTSQKRRKKERKRQNEERLVCLCVCTAVSQLTIGPEYKPPVIQ